MCCVRFYRELTAQYYCIFDDLSNEMNLAKLHHSNTLTVGTNPGRTITDTPFVFLKTFLADLKTAWTTPAEFLFFLTTMTPVLSKTFTPVTPFLFCHANVLPPASIYNIFHLPGSLSEQEFPVYHMDEVLREVFVLR